ncbi:MAG: ROK family protein [Clostridia bacterium]|nr:ROK family protein [Clostridia bacterium]
MYNIGIDLGGTNIAVGIVTKEGKVLKKTSVPARAERPFDQIFADMASCIRQLFAETGIKESEIESIGIGTPGCIDTEKGILIFAGNFKYGKNIDYRAEMAKHFDIPVYIGNDANVAALAEVRAGAAKGVKNAIMITLGTGVGGGIIIDGKIFEGAYSAAGELGHIVLISNGEQCSCGRKGCWEAYASVTALVRQTKAAMLANPDSIMNKTPLEQVSGRTAFDAAKKGDKAALAVVDQYQEYITEGLADMINIFSPEVIVVGGGISKEGDYLLNPVREKIKSRVFGIGLLPDRKILPAELGNDAGIIGAAMLHA